MAISVETARENPNVRLLDHSRTIVRPELPFTARLSSDRPSDVYSDAILLHVPRLTFEVARAALINPGVMGVVVDSPVFPDHARKMLCEGRKVLVHCQGGEAALCDGHLYQVDNHGLIDIDSMPVPVTAICSHISELTTDIYRQWNITAMGYFRLKFCLFDLFATDPTIFDKPLCLQELLTRRLHDLQAQGWNKIRVVLSDATSAELVELGVRSVAPETNPELGIRGPRDRERWWPEIRAIEAFLSEAHGTELDVCVPFVASSEEFIAVADMFNQTRIGNRVKLGLTLEVPAMAYGLDELMRVRRPAFIAVGTSDLLALLNAVDRNQPAVRIDPFGAANTAFISKICAKANHYDVPFFVCGELRRESSSVTRLVVQGCSELIAGASQSEIALIFRAAAQGLKSCGLVTVDEVTAIDA
jgi:PEP-utilizing family enzyme